MHLNYILTNEEHGFCVVETVNLLNSVRLLLLMDSLFSELVVPKNAKYQFGETQFNSICVNKT